MTTQTTAPDHRLHDTCQVAMAAWLYNLARFIARADMAVDTATLLPSTRRDAILAGTGSDDLLQALIATADQVAAGGEHNPAEPPHTARLLPLFEQIRLDGNYPLLTASHYRYHLQPLSPATLFPVATQAGKPADDAGSHQAYAQLWRQFQSALGQIPRSHGDALPLWLDHFETACVCYTAAIPSSAAPDVSLYDHAKTVAALTVTLWRYHTDQSHDPDSVRRALADRSDWQDAKFLLIQGDFFGIQDFIFATGGDTQKKAAKLLRGRSFYVSLITECATLHILETLDLPGTSQITNAAGKFLIIAPNTPETIAKLTEVQQELDRWFLRHTYGQSGIGLAWLPACCNDFLKSNDQQRPFTNLIKRLFEQLETTKRRRFSLCGANPPPPLFAGYLDQFTHGECRIDGRSPATREIAPGIWVSDLAADQIAIGKYLTTCDRILLTRIPLGSNTLATPIFGYSVTFTGDTSESGLFGPEVRSGNLRRGYDFSMPQDDDQPLWNGFARRYLNGFIPRFEEINAWDSDKYSSIDLSDVEFDPNPNEPKTLNHLACEDRQPDQQQRWIGVTALMTLKGDVDNLGTIFQRGLGEPTFAHLVALSRQMNAFFAIYLPWLCHSHSEFKNTYTVFAGGDDFFLIGPWWSQIRLAQRLRADFNRYVTGNPAVTFSAGLSMTKPGMPIRAVGTLAEQALEKAKGHKTEPAALATVPKNAVHCFGWTVGWDGFEQLLQASGQLALQSGNLKFSSGYLYQLLRLTDMAENLRSGHTGHRGERQINVENALWYSQFAYHTRRFLERQKSMTETTRRHLQQELAAIIAGDGIGYFAGAYQIALFIHLYQQRD
jgi:CRISPR-associated protein Csm1